MKKQKDPSNVGSTSIAGDNTGTVTNVHIEPGSQVELNLATQTTTSKLPSFLGKLIVYFAQQQINDYGATDARTLGPEIIEKFEFNNLPTDDDRVIEYTRYISILENSYKGIEQRNADVRFLVRRKAKHTYKMALSKFLEESNTPIADQSAFVRSNSSTLISNTVNTLLKDYKNSEEVNVEEELAHLAVSLIVIDATAACDLLERPNNAATS